MLQNISMRMMALMLFSALFFSCEDPKNIGLPLGGGEYVTTFTDTLTVNTSTVLLDSTATDGNEDILIGRVDDLVFGKNTAKANFQVTLPAAPNQNTGVASYLDYTLVDGTEYDSVYVYFLWNGIIQGDTTKPITLSIHRLTAELSKTKRLQSTDSAPIDPKPLATKTFTYNDFKRTVKTGATLDSLIRFKLPNEFGRELFALGGKYKSTDNDKFMTDFKGLALVANQASAIYGFRLDEATLTVPGIVRLWVHKTGETTAQSISFRAREKKYTEYTSDRKGTDTERFKDKGVAISSKETNGKTYFQSGVGISTKLEIPYLKNLASKGRIAINKAELVLSPEENTTGVFLVPLEVSLARIDAKNQPIYLSNALQFIPFDGASGAGGFSVGYNDKKYSFNITNHIQDILNGKKTNDNFVITPYYTVQSTSTGTTGVLISHRNIRRMILNAKNVKLNIYYSAPAK